MLKLPLYGNQKLRLAIEYGVVIATTAQAQGVELTKELMERAEKVLEAEFRIQTPTRLAVEMVPNILAIFETDLTK